ncbi:MAG: anthranilate synthase component I family protein [Nonlabens sp.]
MKERSVFNYKIENVEGFKTQLLNYLSDEDHVFYLNSNNGFFSESSLDLLVGIGCLQKVECSFQTAFEQLEKFQKDSHDWMFGWLGYDLKNELEDLSTDSLDPLEFPDLCFVIPEHVFEISVDELQVHSFASRESVDHLVKSIKSCSVENKEYRNNQNIHIHSKYSKEEYLEKAQNFLDHIQRGDIYEANFCTQFLATDVAFDDLKAYQDLNEISRPPFSAWVRCGDYRVVSASPERYLKKKERKLISQPIKGTAKRSHDKKEDSLLKEKLFTDIKERSENVMIVDLVRNDLSKTAVKGSVEVEELYGIYSFKQVHHMISTVSSQLSDEFTGLDAIKSTFPMGSMTGAPKVSAMKIIEEKENFKRGLYSGAIGYFKPNGDFDFNVVIRSILYNANLKKLSFAVGSALTIAADPDKEYEECLLKAKALFETLSEQGINLHQKND